MKVTKRALALFAGLFVLAASAVSVRAEEGSVKFTKGIIDPARTCSVTIRNYVSNNGEAASSVDGNAAPTPELLPDGAVPMNDVGFSYMKLSDLVLAHNDKAAQLVCTNIAEPFLDLAREIIPWSISQETCDLDTFSDVFNRANALSEPSVRLLASRHGEQMRLTDEDGVTSVAGLSTGLYLFAEIKSPEGVVPGSPFLVILPQPNIMEMQIEDTTFAPGEIWLYDVTVYPKSRSVSIDKVIVPDDDGSRKDQYTNNTTACIGDTVSFLITSDIPKLPSDTRNRKYIISDELSKGLSFIGPVSISLGETESTAEALTEKSNFKVNLARSDSGETLLVTFTKKGLARLGRVESASHVYMRYSAMLNPDADIEDSGNTNIAQLTYGTDRSDDLYLTSPPVSVHTYQLNLKKIFTPAEEHFGKVKFSVSNDKGKLYFVKESDGIYHVSCPDEESSETTAISPNDISGLLTIKGLANDTYKITEEETLPDYSLFAEPIIVTIKNRNMRIEVENKKAIDLVHTGGAGLAGILAGAAALISAGILVIVYAKRKG